MQNLLLKTVKNYFSCTEGIQKIGSTRERDEIGVIEWESERERVFMRVNYLCSTVQLYSDDKMTIVKVQVKKKFKCLL